MYQPVVDGKRCVSCGRCVRICPGLGHMYPEQRDVLAVRGDTLAVYNAWSNHPHIRHVSASGGVISTLLQGLLADGIYDGAFVLDSYDYSRQLVSKPVFSGDISKLADTEIPKSRYLPVSHALAVDYVRKHPQKRMIFIGTGCAVQGFLRVVEEFRLNRENYLIIGLFCDKVFNYNVVDYFRQDRFCNGKTLIGLHFKNKESGGWPGNMKFLFRDGSAAYHGKEERARVKEYFMPERCLYCINKLNHQADIALGDNYTSYQSTELGSNSVIIRTERGRAAFSHCQENLTAVPVDITAIEEAQFIRWRLNNLCFARLREAQIL